MKQNERVFSSSYDMKNGLSLKEYAAVQILAGMVAGKGYIFDKELATQAVLAAEELAKALTKSEEKSEK